MNTELAVKNIVAALLANGMISAQANQKHDPYSVQDVLKMYRVIRANLTIKDLWNDPSESK